jgi:hypothetical protein
MAQQQRRNNMALITPDFSEIKEDVVPGTYKGIIKKGEVKEWPNGGQYVNWEVETYGETEAKNNGRRIFIKTSVSGKGAFVLQKLYKAATGEPLTGKFDTEQLVGKQVEVDMAERNGYIEMKNVRPVTAN